MRTKKYVFIAMFFILVVFVGFAENVPGTFINLDDIEAYDVLSILSDNIFDVFRKDLNHKEYNSDLKKKIFLESNEAKKYIERLNDLKNLLRTKGIKSIFLDQDVHLSNYDINNKGFWLDIGTNAGMGTLSGSYKYSINGFVYEKLPVIQTGIEYAPSTHLKYKLLLKTSEDKALKIEDCPKIGIQLEMKISGMENKTFLFFSYDGYTYEVKRRHPVAVSLKLSIFNKKTGEILEEYTY